MKKKEKLLLIAAIIIGIILIIQNAVDRDQVNDAKQAAERTNVEVGSQKIINTSEKDAQNNVSYIVVEPEDLAFGKTGGSESVDIDTDAENWDISNVPSWLSVTKDGNTLNVECQSNHSEDNRETKLIFKAGDKSAIVFVTQTATPTQLSVNQSEFSLERTGGSFTVDVTTDADDWYAECSSGGLSLSKDGNKLHVSIPYLNGPSTTWQICVKVNFHGSTLLTKYITAKQKGYCSSCRGTGRNSCMMCHGTGRETDYSADIPIMIPCSYCNGRGVFTCGGCDGTGNSKY